MPFSCTTSSTVQREHPQKLVTRGVNRARVGEYYNRAAFPISLLQFLFFCPLCLAALVPFGCSDTCFCILSFIYALHFSEYYI